MNTNNIKSFAQRVRVLLLDGVEQRLKYWGFDENGNNDQKLQTIENGYIFRNNVFTGSEVPEKWNALKKRLKSKEDVKDVIEEASYTWFNRLMAIKILEVNNHIEPTLAFVDGMQTPVIVQNAKRGTHHLTRENDKNLLLEYLKEDKEEQAFGLLITHLCNYKSKLLHEIFGRIDDYTEILLPQNLLQKGGVLDLINKNDDITEEDYKQVELIGWLYQFYISEKKDEVFSSFKKGKKARAEDIPSATQIFTPKWIVEYMVENTVGKIYLDYEPDSTLRDDMKYLVTNEDNQDTETPIINDITELTLIDPACGSGHILVTGFDKLYSMYKEAGYTTKQSVQNIIKNNLFGLDIDDRAMQLARFAVLLKASSYDKDILDKDFILPHVYSFPTENHFTTEELQDFLGTEGDAYTAELRDALKWLSQGKNIGSALKVKLSAKAYSFIEKQYDNWQEKNENFGLDALEQSTWNRLYPFLEVLLTLTKKYTAVVANPPYMGQKNMNGELKTYVNKHYPISKSDFFAVFMEVCLDLNTKSGLMGMINQHSWMFLSSYEKLRNEILNNYGIVNMLHLGPRTFEELSGEVVQSTAFVLHKAKELEKGTYYRLVDYKTNTEKEKQFLKKSNRYPNVPQANFSKIPGSPIAYWVSEKVVEIFEKGENLTKYGNVKVGLQTGNNNRFRRNWTEVFSSKTSFNKGNKWFPYNSGGGYRKWYGNQFYVVNWRNDGEEIKDFEKSVVRNEVYYFEPSISWSKIAAGGLGVRYFPKGFIFDVAGCSIFEKKNGYNLYLLGLLNSNLKKVLIESISPTLNYEVGQISNVPVIFSDKKEIEDLIIICINLSKKDWDSRETSWDFQQSPLFNGSQSVEEAYQSWEDDVTKDFFQLHANEEELNRIFIDIYGLEEELTPEVVLEDITILQEELNSNALNALEPVFREQGKEAIKLPIDRAEVISQFLSYAIGVFLGRYRLDKPGLNIAHPNPTEEETASYTYNNHTTEIDEDAIIPLMGEDCAFPDDVLLRTKDLIHTIWGEDSLTENINFIQEALGMDLHKWLTEKFWKYHTKMYKKKPIYWLFSSNVKKPQSAAFKVLVYMHRMDKYTVQKIQRNYLHPHQAYIKQRIERLEENESSLDRKEQKELDKLRNWELECRDYNEVLKNLANLQIDFDLDDGVTENYAKFEGAVAKI